jgi:class 3 adenylate cyclase
MKTDISGSTSRFRELLAADLQALLSEHRDFLARHAAEHDGRIIKGAGDGHWLEFPSVTSAAKAAIAMQEALRLAQLNRGDDRLAIRIVIRSFLYGRDVWIASRLQNASAKLLDSHEYGIFVTGAVRSALLGNPSHNRFRPVTLEPPPAALAGLEVYRLCNKVSE